jgi:hypothetical protein
MVLLGLCTFAQAQKPPKYAFKKKADTTTYEKGENIYLIHQIYKQWDGEKFKYGFYKKDTEEHLTEAVYDTLHYKYLHKKRFGFYHAKKSNKWGLLKEDRSIWVPFNYDKLHYNSHIKDYYISVENQGKYGILDGDGKVILSAIYDDILYDGVNYKVIQNGKTGIMDSVGKELIPVCFDVILYDKKFEAQQLQKDGKWSLLNWNKSNPCQPVQKYDQIEKHINDFFVARDDTKYGLVDINGKEILPFEYEYMSPFFVKFLGALLVGKDGKVGLLKVLADGTIETKVPIAYHDIWVDKRNNKLKVKLGDKIDYYYDDQTLYEMAYNDVVYYERINRCMVKKGKKWGMLTLDGETVIPIAYSRIHIMENKQFMVQKGTKWGVLDDKGRQLLAPIYDEFDFRPEKKIFFVNKKGLWGIVSLRDGVVLPPKYQEMFALPNRKFLVKQKDKWGIVASGGRVIIPLEYDSYQYKYKMSEVKLINASGQVKKYRIQ